MIKRIYFSEISVGILQRVKHNGQNKDEYTNLITIAMVGLYIINIIIIKVDVKIVQYFLNLIIITLV